MSPRETGRRTPLAVVGLIGLLVLALLPTMGVSCVEFARVPRRNETYTGHRPTPPPVPAAKGVDLFESVLDTSQPELRSAVNAARKDGLTRGIQMLRAYHRRLPRQPYLRESRGGNSWASMEEEAVRTLRHGYPIEGRGYLSLKPPIDWAADPLRDRSWRMWLHAWGFLDSVMNTYERTGDRAYMDFARRIALDWIRQNLNAAHPSDVAWHEMAEGARSATLAMIADDALRNSQVSEKDLMSLLEASYVHAETLADPSELNKQGNLGMFQMGGLLALSKALPELRRSLTRRDYAVGVLNRRFDADFSSEGVQLEHSPSYNVFLVNHMGLLLKTGWMGRDEPLRQLFAKATRNIIWLMHPDGIVARIGDSDAMTVKESILFPDDPYVQYALSEGREGTRPASSYQVFRRAGYAIFRSPWNLRPWRDASYLIFEAAFHSVVHKHADDFTFEWYDLGRRLVIDSGRFGYEYKDPRREYVESTAAHNTVEIDRKDYSRDPHSTFGSAITAAGEADGMYFVEADHYRKEFRTSHRRILVFSPGRWVVVIDDLRSSVRHQFTQWFHLTPDLASRRIPGGFEASVPDGDDTLRLISLSPGEGVTTRLIRGQRSPRMQGWTSMLKSSMTANDAIGFDQSGLDATYVTLLWIGNARTAVRPELVRRNSTGLQWVVGWTSGRRHEGFRFDIRGDSRTLRALE